MNASSPNAGTRDTSGGPAGSPLEVLRVFLKLGSSSFGGPIAHIGYFRQEFVVRRRWLDEQAFVDLVALCQFLPGPASSQVGLFDRADTGRLCAVRSRHGPVSRCRRRLCWFCSRTAPARSVGRSGAGLLHGLKLVAVAIVAQAVWGMARTLCPDRERASIAVMTRADHSVQQFVGGADRSHFPRRRVRSVALPRRAAADGGPYRHAGVAPRREWSALTVFFVLLVGLPILQRLSDLARRRAVRRVLSFGRAGVRRRPRRAAAAARGVRRARLGERRCVSRRLRCRAGGSGPVVHLRRLSRRRRRAVAARRRRCGARARSAFFFRAF